MSLVEAERALIDLLFDEGLRNAFAREGVAALSGYALSDDERADFAGVNVRGLMLDARMRRDLMLARLARTFPVSFAVSSALSGGMALLARLLGPSYVRASRATRTAQFGESLRDALGTLSFPDERTRAFAMPFVAVEVALAWSSARVREQALAGAESAEPVSRALPARWEQRALRLAPNLCVAVLPRPYAAVKAELCPVEVEQLWARLEKTPLPERRLRQAFAEESPRLFVGRAVLVRASRCEATVEHVTLELSEGFAPLLRALDGRHSADTLLQKLASAAAPPRTLEAVRAGLGALVERGMLTLT